MPEPWTPNFGDDEPNLSGAVHQALGAVALCWSGIEDAGVFQSEQATWVAEGLLAWIAEHVERAGDWVEDAPRDEALARFEALDPEPTGDTDALIDQTVDILLRDMRGAYVSQNVAFMYEKAEEIVALFAEEIPTLREERDAARADEKARADLAISFWALENKNLRALLAATEAVCADREVELLTLKGPCSTTECRLHYAHSGPCDIARGSDA